MINRKRPGACEAPVRPRGSRRTFVLVAIGSVMSVLGFTAPARAAKDPAASNVVYVTSNNPDEGRNSVLAYRRDPGTGALALIGNYLTRGTGFFNDDERLGPDDSDQELIASPDHKFLFAVNQGSDTIAVFDVRADGSLEHVNGSPFPSGGVQPVSLGLAGNQLYVVNKGDSDPDGQPPNYTGFRVAGNGRLSPIPKSTIELPPGSEPTQALVAPGGNLVFGIDLFLFEFPPPPPALPPFIPKVAFSGLESFRIQPNGRLERAPGSPQPPPPAAGPPFLLGLKAHPTQPLLYVGFVLGNAIGTFEYNATGALTFLDRAANSGLAICWIEVNRAGTFAYTSDSTSDSISTYSLADPRHPVEIQNLDLKGPKALLPPEDQPAPTLFNTTPFQLALDPAGRFLYVLNHETTLANNFPEGNAIHILRVGADGKLTEIPNSPVILPEKIGIESVVPARAHPQGVVVF